MSLVWNTTDADNGTMHLLNQATTTSQRRKTKAELSSRSRAPKPETARPSGTPHSTVALSAELWVRSHALTSPHRFQDGLATHTKQLNCSHERPMWEPGLSGQ